MGLRDEVRRAYRRDGLAGVWEWAKGRGPRGWRAAANWAEAVARDAKVTLTKRRKQRDRVAAELHDLHDRALDLAEKIERERKRKHPDQKKLAGFREDLRALERRTKTKEGKRRRAIAKAHHSIERRKWAVKATTVYRRKLRRARKHAEQTGKPRFEPYMLNGHSANITEAVEDEVAISVVDFGCAVSSTYRPTVIPQSNPYSFHGPHVSPGEAFDCVSARKGRRGSGMVAYQRDVFTRRRGNCKESFGPSNSECLKNGSPITLGEGTFLEQLHDSHEHCAP